MTDTITVKNLQKTFETKVKEPGLAGSVKSLLKPQYKETKAVDGISFTIKKGELVGFIGPNGAGKSTTLKILTGILHPTGGEASVLGITPWRDRKKLAYKLGTVFGQRSQMWTHLPPQDSFDLFAAIYDLDKTEYKKRLAYLVDAFGIQEFLAIPVRKLSLGQRMRCELVAALLHKPHVLYLDEPSIGLDILAKKALREHIQRINKDEGVTVILTSHDIDDIEELCERVIIINHGRIVADTSFEELRKSYLQKKLVTVYLKRPAKRYAQDGIAVISETNDKVVHEVDTSAVNLQKTIAKLTEHYDFEDIEITDPPIEEVIGEIYKRKR